MNINEIYYATDIAVDKPVKFKMKTLMKDICEKHCYSYFEDDNKHVFTVVTNAPPTYEELKDKFFILLNELGNNTKNVTISVNTRHLFLCWRNN